MSEEIERSLERLGLDETNLKNLKKNANKVKLVVETLNETGITDDTYSKSIGFLIVLASSCTPKHRPLVASYIGNKKIKTSAQVDAAIKFFKSNASKSEINIPEFEKSCGVGVEMNVEQIKQAVAKFIDANRQNFVQDRYLTNIGQVLPKLRAYEKDLLWADGKKVMEELKSQLVALWGPETEEDKQRAKAGKKKVQKEAPKPEKNAPKSTTTTTTTITTPKTNEEEEDDSDKKFEARFLESAVNPPEILKAHLETTGGKVITRFPPEPNGFLHIGHAKSMNLNFGFANRKGGHTYLRYDDTNPEKEEEVYYKSIKEMVEWIGFTPWKITYTSDYFDEMYDCAIKLIKDGKAYIDFSSKKEMKDQRDNKLESPYRNTTVEENLRRFEDMKLGLYGEGEAVLRCKIDMKNDNPNMRDFIAYRVKYVPHPRTGDKWCIYPTYDFSHCIVDSLENVTHSLCTLEFENRRDSYYWLLQALNMYRPHVYEFSKLNVEYSLLSKRNVNRLVREGIVRGWDDPRLLTLAGLRRRGYPPEAIISLCKEIGVSRHENLIPMERLELCCRLDLDVRCDRAFAILEPLRVIITNFANDKVDYVSAPNHPKDKSRGERKLPFSKVVYIERKDFRLKDEKDYFGLAPNKEVGLRYGPNILCTDVIQDSDGNIVEIKATADFEKKKKPKGHIHWLAQPSPGVDPKTAEVRLYENLFDCKVIDPSDNNWYKHVRKDSEAIVPAAFVDPIFNDSSKCKVFTKYQFERVGYFSVDTDTTKDSLVFNRVVTLKESYPKFSKGK